jgi:hypothetical protein
LGAAAARGPVKLGVRLGMRARHVFYVFACSRHCLESKQAGWGNLETL